MTSAELQVDGALERNISHSNDTMQQVAKDAGNDTDFGAVMYIIIVLTFYSLGIVVMIIKYLKTEQKEMEEEMILESFFRGIPNKRIEHEIESVNRVAIQAFHTLTAPKSDLRGDSNATSVESSIHTEHLFGRDSEDQRGGPSHTSPYNEIDDRHHQQTASSLQHGYYSNDMNYSSTDQSSLPRQGGHRRKRRIGHRWVEGETAVTRDPNIDIDILSEYPGGVCFVPDIEANVNEIEMKCHSSTNDTSFSASDPLQSKMCHSEAQGDKRFSREREETPFLNERWTTKGNSSNDIETPAKRTKTVIFSDAIKPSHKDIVAPKCDITSETRSPKSAHTQQSIVHNTDDISSKGNASSIIVPPYSSTADSCTLKKHNKEPTQIQRILQIKPWKWKDDLKATVKSQPMPTSASCNALDDALGCDKGQCRRTEMIESNSLPEEDHRGAFANENSMLHPSTKHNALPCYDAMSSRPVLTARVTIVNPQNKDNISKKVLVTDL